MPRSRGLNGPHGPKVLIAHRGHSAHAPEHTLPAFELALASGADYLEHDLQITRDGVLVCLHDQTLDRTTNVADVFPERARAIASGSPAGRWFVHDFALAEVRALDAGAWFDAAFAGARVPTFLEALAAAAGRAELCVELKDPDVYERLGVDMLTLFAAELARVSQRPIVQSFHEPTMRRAARVLDPSLPRVLLIEPEDAHKWNTAAALGELSAFVTGIGPKKDILAADPDLVSRAHTAGLTVTPWTFRSRSCAPFPDVKSEMAHYLDVLDVDGVITDHPDQFPRSHSSRGHSSRDYSSRDYS